MRFQADLFGGPFDELFASSSGGKIEQHTRRPYMSNNTMASRYRIKVVALRQRLKGKLILKYQNNIIIIVVKYYICFNVLFKTNGVI